ncbi:MAG: hypothetical protein Q8935_04275 [Bacillota bacterium]|nr:hypothetical protein [Bacillota bacterium]
MKKRTAITIDGKSGKSKIVKMMLYQNKSRKIKKSDINTSITNSRSERISLILGRLYRNLNGVTFLLL